MPIFGSSKKSSTKVTNIDQKVTPTGGGDGGDVNTVANLGKDAIGFSGIESGAEITTFSDVKLGRDSSFTIESLDDDVAFAALDFATGANQSSHQVFRDALNVGRDALNESAAQNRDALNAIESLKGADRNIQQLAIPAAVLAGLWIIFRDE
jgi:hypothetical protein